MKYADLLRQALAVVLIWFGSAMGLPAQAQVPSQQEVAKLLARDGAANDQFGVSVGVYGDTAVVGAFGDDDNGLGSGSAYLFHRDEMGHWIEKQKLIADDGAPSDSFGWSVSISDDTVLVGSPQDADNGSYSGSAYVYVRNSIGVWTQQQKLTASDGVEGDMFGNSVAVSGNAAVVGAYFASNTGIRSGAVYVYVRDAAGVWAQHQKIAPADLESGDNFGNAVSVSGDTIVIGSYGEDGIGNGSGAAYVFARNASGVWEQQQKLRASDGDAQDQFGNSVAVFGDTALVGAWAKYGNYSGAAYVYVRNAASNWTQQQKLTAGDGLTVSQFGRSVSLSDSTAAIGSDGGPAYLFARNAAGEWNQQHKLVPIAASVDQAFGWSISVAGETILGGAAHVDDSGVSAGAAFVFSLKPAITFPRAGSVLAGGTEAIAIQPGISDVSEYWLYAGPSAGSPDFFSSGSLPASTASISVTGLPSNGAHVYMRLWYRVNGNPSWYWKDFGYTAAGSAASPVLTSYAPGSALPGPGATIAWDDNGVGATAYWLYVGSSVGDAQYYSSGNVGTSTSTTVNTLPIDGSDVFVRLWYQAGSSAWHYVDATYTAASLASPEITSPAPDGTLTSAVVPFSWTNNGSGASNWWLYAGSAPGGAQYFASGSLGSSTNISVTGLPDDGSTVYVRVWYQFNGSSTWRFLDATYTAVTGVGVEITEPVDSTLSGSSQTFSWTDNGTGVTEWWLYIGSSPFGKQYYDSGSLGSTSSVSISELPLDGSDVHVTLWHRMGQGIWYFQQKLFQAAGRAQKFQHPFGIQPRLYTAANDGDGWQLTNEFKEPTISQRSGHEGHVHLHLGEDWVPEQGGAAGQPVLAVADGRIVFTGYHASNGFGNTVVLRHDLSSGLSGENVVYSLYAHLGTLTDFSGNATGTISAGTEIGRLGSSGAANGAHLHLEIFSADWNAYLSGSLIGLWGYAEEANFDTVSGGSWRDPTDYISDRFE